MTDGEAPEGPSADSAAHLRGGVPVLFGFSLNDYSGAAPVEMGGHAVAVTGYSLGSPAPTTHATSGLALVASRVDKLYAHDDQVGPFARMEIEEKIVPAVVGGESVQVPARLSTSWLDHNQKRGNIYAIPQLVLVPLYHKIRIPYDVVHDEIAAFNRILDTLLHVAPVQAALNAPQISFLWDIFLSTNVQLKSDLRREGHLAGATLRECMVMPLPRFVWRARATASDAPVLDVIIDATDIHQGNMVATVIQYDQLPAAAVKSFVANAPPDVLSEFRRLPGWRVIKFLAQ